MEQLGYPTTSPEMEQRLENIFSQGNYHTLVAVCDGHVVGMIGMCVGWQYEAGQPYGQIMALVVAQGHRGHRIGARLVTEGEHWLQDRGAGPIIVNSGNMRHATHRFYERLGYQATGVRFVKTMLQEL
jgi:GNAT superfamily N-acetyltransferase